MTATVVPMITLRMLRGACPEQREIFKAEWPGGAEATLENVLRAQELGLDLLWGADHLFTPEARAEYERQITPIWDEYQSQEAPIRAERDRQWATIRAEYERQSAPILAEYDRQWATIWTEYDRQRAPIRAERDRQWATIWTEYDRQSAAIWTEYDRQSAPLWLAALLASLEGTS